jgi:hypothetical protein
LDKDSTDTRNDINETVNLIDKTIQAIEVQLLCNSSQQFNEIYDQDLLLVCLQRLVNVTTHIVLDIDPTSDYMDRLVKFWRLIRNSSTHIMLQNECAQFILVGPILVFTKSDLEDACMFIKKILQHPGDTNVNHVLKAVMCTRSLITKNSSIVCKVRMKQLLTNICNI